MINKTLAISIIFIIGCGSHTNHFIVYRNVPNNPSFIVLPPSSHVSEINFANKIEQILISCHVSVHLRPAIKYIESKQADRQTDTHRGDTSSQGASKTEWYYELEDFSADYIVQSYKDAYMVKISKRDTQEVLAVINLPKPRRTEYDRQLNITQQTPQQVLAKVLDNLGIIHLNTKK